MNLLDSTKGPGILLLSLSDQVFTFVDAEGGQWHWNASEGMRIALASGREPLAFYPTDHGLDIPQLQSQYTDLDLEYALTTDLTKPILFIPFWDGTHVLIDGWHRLAHAVLKGVPYLLAHELTPEEAAQVLVMRIPLKECLQH
ncbi:MAG: hypothetical protein QM758_13160 [Armatimonas sp.]